MKSIFALLPRLWANSITLLGAILATMSGLATLLFVVLELSAGESNPYTSSLLVVVLPFVFVFGLLMIPVGLWLDRRKQRTADPDGPPDPVQEAFRAAIKDRSARNRILFVAVLTVVNVVLFTVAGHKAVTYMDSPKFCGTTCHSVMQPEWEAYNRSPHSRVECVQCHIGPGASWFVRSKINGLHQVWGVLVGDYHRPVPTPVEHLRPSRDTCEQCHWPDRFTGNQVKLFPHYKDDKDNAPSFTAQLLQIGGQNPRTHEYQGIHWHVAADTTVKYEYLDRERQKIGKITVEAKGKPAVVYMPPKELQGKPAIAERTMDCVDCHNRPTHRYDGTPRQAIETAIYAGMIDKSMPYIVQIGTSLLARKDVPRDTAYAWFRAQLVEQYKPHGDVALPDGKLIDQAATTMAMLYNRNVYPKMNITWNTYRSNLSHVAEGDDKVGCFRCHDSDREAKLPDGTTKTMSQDCELCHQQLAFEDDPAKFDETLKALLPSQSP